MSCPGAGHCAGCVGGGGVSALGFTALFGATWVAEHIAEVTAVSVVCAALSVAAVVALMRRGDRRDARQRDMTSLWSVRADAEPLPARVVPSQVSQGTVPAIEQHVHYHYHVAESRDLAHVVTGEVMP